MIAYQHLDVTRQDRGVTVRFLDQRLMERTVIDETAKECQAVALDPGCRRLTLDCSRVRHLGSEMLGKLLALDKTLRSRNATLSLSGLRSTIRQAFRVTHVDTLFNIFD